MPLDSKAKVSLSTFRPKAHGQAAYEKEKLMLGVLVGVAFGKSVKNNQEKPDEPFVGLTGNFRCVLASNLEDAVKCAVTGVQTDKASGVQSGICYLPDAWLNPILKILETAESVEFAHKVSIEKADNPAGYSWVLTPLKEATGNDPLAHVLSNIPGVPQIEDKSGETETEKPETGTPAVKGGKAA